MYKLFEGWLDRPLGLILDVAETLKSVGALKTIGDPKMFLDEVIITEAYERYRKK